MAGTPNIITQKIPRGVRYSSGSAQFISLDGVPGLGDEPVRNAIGVVADLQTDAAANLLPERVAAHLWEVIGARTVAAVASAFDVAKAAARTANEADAVIMTPVEAPDPMLAMETRQCFRALEPAAQAYAIDQADLVDLTAVVASGNRAGLDAPIWEAAVERYREENTVVKMALPASHPMLATVDRPLALGPDMDAARAAAKEKLAEHDDRLARVEQAERSATDLLQFLAVIFATTPEALLDAVTGRN